MIINFIFCFWVSVFVFFNVDHFLKVFIEFVTILLLLCFGFLAMRDGDLCSLTRDRTHTSCIRRQALTTGPPMKVKVAQFFLTLCDLMGYIVHGIL